MIEWTDEQLASAAIDKKKLASLVKRLRKCSADMRALGLYVYGASGSGNLVHNSRPTHIDRPGLSSTPDFGCVVARVGEGFDGGDW